MALTISLTSVFVSTCSFSGLEYIQKAPVKKPKGAGVKLSSQDAAESELLAPEPGYCSPHKAARATALCCPRGGLHGGPSCWLNTLAVVGN